MDARQMWRSNPRISGMTRWAKKLIARLFERPLQRRSHVYRIFQNHSLLESFNRLRITEFPQRRCNRAAHRSIVVIKRRDQRRQHSGITSPRFAHPSKIFRGALASESRHIRERFDCAE